MNPFNVLEPNYLGHSETNTGVDNLRANMGWGVAEAMPETEESAGVHKVKVSTAKQFGKPAHQVF